MQDNIQVKDLNQQLSEDQHLQVIDIRNGDAFAIGHIPGALNIPIQRMQYHPDSIYGDKRLVLYTSQGVIGAAPENEEPPDENLVHEMAAELRKNGYKVTVLQGGLNAWIEAGLPVERE